MQVKVVGVIEAGSEKVVTLAGSENGARVKVNLTVTSDEAVGLFRLDREFVLEIKPANAVAPKGAAPQQQQQQPEVQKAPATPPATPPASTPPATPPAR